MNSPHRKSLPQRGHGSLTVKTSPCDLCEIGEWARILHSWSPFTRKREYPDGAKVHVGATSVGNAEHRNLKTIKVVLTLDEQPGAPDLAVTPLRHSSLELVMSRRSAQRPERAIHVKT
jgi:hypothetical protein